MINEMIPESHLVKLSTSIDKERYQIRFLNPQPVDNEGQQDWIMEWDFTKQVKI